MFDITPQKNSKLPVYYAPNLVRKLYLPRMSDAAAAGEALQLVEAEKDRQRIMLLLIDPQIDFIFPEGSLCVPGAVEDTRRTIEWIYTNTAEITNISISLDSHTAFQIFSPGWWADCQGLHPAPFTPISATDVRKGVWQPLVEKDWSLKYVEELEKGGKYALMIWPYHTMIGSPGQAVVPALSEAIMFHASARKTQPHWLNKGSIPQTENYSIMEPEVKIPGNPLGGLNSTFLDLLGSYDLIYIAGQAKSHCVLATLRSIMNYFQTNPNVISKLRLLTDCTSSVQHPEINFDELADKELVSMSLQGMGLVKSDHKLG